MFVVVVSNFDMDGAIQKSELILVPQVTIESFPATRAHERMACNGSGGRSFVVPAVLHVAGKGSLDSRYESDAQC